MSNTHEHACLDTDPHPAHPAGTGMCPGSAHADCAEAAYWAALEAPRELGDEGWQALEDRSVAAGYDPTTIRSRRRRDDFTKATIEAAYQYGLQRAAQAARELGGKDTRG